MPLSTYDLSHSTPGYFLSPLNERFQANHEKDRWPAMIPTATLSSQVNKGLSSPAAHQITGVKWSRDLNTSVRSSHTERHREQEWRCPLSRLLLKERRPSRLNAGGPLYAAAFDPPVINLTHSLSTWWPPRLGGLSIIFSWVKRPRRGEWRRGERRTREERKGEDRKGKGRKGMKKKREEKEGK